MSKETILDRFTMIASQTDEKGIILYANDEFCKIAGYTTEQLIGKNHNIIRHPDMPRAAFKELWTTVKAGNVWQGFVKNRTKNGGFYWVYATVFPFGKDHYLSVRKMATREEIVKYEGVYKQMCASEVR